MPDYSKHQKKIIERYYDHRDVIMLTKLGEIVTELYLATSDKKRDQLWSTIWSCPDWTSATTSLRWRWRTPTRRSPLFQTA